MSKNSISGVKIFSFNQNLFAVILQAFLEAMWRVQTQKEVEYKLIMSNINSSSEFLYFEELFKNGIKKLCPEIKLKLGLTITNLRAR